MVSTAMETKSYLCFTSVYFGDISVWEILRDDDVDDDDNGDDDNDNDDDDDDNDDDDNYTQLVTRHITYCNKIFSSIFRTAKKSQHDLVTFLDNDNVAQLLLPLYFHQEIQDGDRICIFSEKLKKKFLITVIVCKITA